MDLAQTIFNVGVGVGALLIGIALLVLVFSLRRLSRDARVLADDLKRVNRTLERLVGADAEAAAPRENRAAEEPPPASVEPAQRREVPGEELIGWWPGRESDGPLQSANQREDERIA